MFTYISLLALLVSDIAAGSGDVSPFCVVRHCISTGLACQQNSICSQALACTQECPKHDDMVCSGTCTRRYGNSQFDDFSVCLIDNKCMEPYPEKKFTAPSFPMNLDMEEFLGTWYVVAGLDKGLDCYTNQSMIVTPDAEDATMLRRDIAIGFPEGIRIIPTQMRQDAPGLYSVRYTIGGL